MEIQTVSIILESFLSSLSSDLQIYACKLENKENVCQNCKYVLKMTGFNQLKSSSHSYILVRGHREFWKMAFAVAHSGTNRCIFTRKQAHSQKHGYKNIMINPL